MHTRTLQGHVTSGAQTAHVVGYRCVVHGEQITLDNLMHKSLDDAICPSLHLSFYSLTYFR